MLFRRIVFYALLLGALSGMVLTVVQFWQVIPIIQAAELYESGSAPAPAGEHAAHSHAAPAHGHAGHEHSADAWAPKDGLQRTGYTLLSNVLTAIGLAVVLLAAMVASLRVNAGTRLGWRYGLLWGIAGYAVFFLAPALGLPPEIPGAVGAPLEARQLWWLSAVVFTAAGLAGAAFGKSPWRWAALGLLAAPYLVGAPHSPTAMFAGQSPVAAAELAVLARQFFGATAVANASLWLVLGLASAWAIRRIVAPLNLPSGSGIVNDHAKTDS